MSLDVYLTIEGEQITTDLVIPYREGGQVKMLTRAEWDERFPGREPIVPTTKESSGEVYWANITHNLNKMADEAGIYETLWRPGEIGIETAGQLIAPLREGLTLLTSDPERFKQFNPANGWGDYEGLCSFVRKYLAACEKWPYAIVYASR